MDSSFWDEKTIKRDMKYDKNSGYNMVLNEDDEYGYSKKKLPRDPLSHRIIEKRRRDRMNNCLSDLSRLIPSEYMKKGRGRVEKTEIIEMAIRHMKHLQAHPCSDGTCCPLVTGVSNVETDRHHRDDRCITTTDQIQQQTEAKVTAADHYRLGFNECLAETMHFLDEVEGFFSSDSVCLQLTSHLHNHCDNILKGKVLMAQISAVAQSKRRLQEMEETSDLKQGSVDGFMNGYQHGVESQRPDQRSDQNGAVTPYQSHGVFPADSSSSLLQNNFTYRGIPRTIAFTQQLSPTLSSSGSDSVGSYKFKADIRKRFCKEAGGVVPVNIGGLSSSRRIPIFALSPRGSYYVPLTLDISQLEDELVRTDQAVLHPVTISVCFPTHSATSHNLQDG